MSIEEIAGYFSRMIKRNHWKDSNCDQIGVDFRSAVIFNSGVDIL